MRTTLFLTAFLVLACGGKRSKAPPAKDAGPGSAAMTPLRRLPPGFRVEAARVRDKAHAAEVVELKLTSSEPIPARALDPVLLVGDREVPDYRYEGPRTLIFTEREPDKLPDRAPIRFRWGPPSSEVLATDQVFDRKAMPTVDR